MARGRLRSALAAAAWCTAACGSSDGTLLNLPGPTETRPSDVPPAVLPGQQVFAEGQVLLVRLTLPPEALLELEEHGDDEVYVATQARLEGRGRPAATFAEIGVRLKGSTSLHHCWDDFGGERSYADE